MSAPDPRQISPDAVRGRPLLVLIDPAARRSDGESVRIAKDVLCAGAAAKIFLPDGPEEVERALARRGSRRPVVVGDHRALLRTVELLHRKRELADAALSVVPVGGAATVALARALGLPTDAVSAARTALDGAARRRDLLVDESGGVVLGGLRISGGEQMAAGAGAYGAGYGAGAEVGAEVGGCGFTPYEGPYDGPHGGPYDGPYEPQDGGYGAQDGPYEARDGGRPYETRDGGADGAPYGARDGVADGPAGSPAGGAVGSAAGGGGRAGVGPARGPGGFSATAGHQPWWTPAARTARSALTLLSLPGIGLGGSRRRVRPPAQRLRVEADGVLLADLDQPVERVSVSTAAGGGLAEVVVHPRAGAGPLRVRAGAITVSGPDFHYRADTVTRGPVRTRTWTVLTGAWHLMLPRGG
ncbi:hypothetical protein ABZ547_27425 [Streptomyces sparsogenes]|uniref:hypothetical protein n=1 Tax=Streptomyces sparsogenes TaxID=67365 RepID=UPI0033E67445